MSAMRVSIGACVAGLAALMLVGGCNPKPVAGKVGEPVQKQAKVIAKDFALTHYFRVEKLEPRRIGGDLLEIRLSLENTAHKDIWCDIQVVFYDKDGFELERTNWQPLLAAYHEITPYKTTSLSSEAADYSIILRNPRTSVGK